MKREYALIAALLATTAAVAVVTRGEFGSAADPTPEAPAPEASAPAAAEPATAAPPTVVGEAVPEAVPETTSEPALETAEDEAPVIGSDVDGLEASLQEREAERERLEAVLGEREVILAEKDAQMRDIEAQLVARSAEVRVLEAEISVLRARSAYEAELVALRAGRAPVPTDTAGAAAPLPRATPDALDTALAEAKGPAAPGAPIPASADVAVPAQIAVPAPQIFAEIHFESASASLTPGGQERVRAAAAALSGMPLAAVEVLGYTDTVGRPEANRRLAARRADSVAVALAEAGLSPTLIASSGLGEDGAPVLTPRGVPEPLNRSVEIVARPAVVAN